MSASPSPIQHRRKRLALRFAAIILLVIALIAVHRVSRPPELVWWTSPPIGRTGSHLSMLIPWGWREDPFWKGRKLKPPRLHEFVFSPRDSRPEMLRRIISQLDSGGIGVLGVEIAEIQYGQKQWSRVPAINKASFEVNGKSYMGTGAAMFEKEKIAGQLFYWRTDLPAFNRTYKEICNSLKIE